MKAGSSFLFVAVAGFLILASVGLLETSKAKAGLAFFKSQESLLMQRWIVADAVNIQNNENVADSFKTLSWQFLGSGSFVEFEEQVINETGAGWLKGQELRIQKEGQVEAVKFIIERLSQRELQLRNADIKIRLLRLDD